MSLRVNDPREATSEKTATRLEGRGPCTPHLTFQVPSKLVAGRRRGVLSGKAFKSGLGALAETRPRPRRAADVMAC